MNYWYKVNIVHEDIGEYLFSMYPSFIMALVGVDNAKKFRITKEIYIEYYHHDKMTRIRIV